MEVIPSEADRARSTLWAGVLVFRWIFFLWMLGLAITTRDRLVLDPLAWASVAVAGLWTIWLTLPGNQENPETPWIDLALAVALVLISAYVVEEGEVIGKTPFFAVMYPGAAALLWGAARGVGGGLFAGALLSVALTLSRPLNGVSLAVPEHVLGLLNGVVLFLAGGIATGVISSLLSRWTLQFRFLMEAQVQAREREARMAEHDALGRRIHDSVLQSLALISKRGRELGAQDRAPGSAVLELADIASHEEQELRSLILRAPEDAPSGSSSLRDALEARAKATHDVPVTVSATGPIWLPTERVDAIMGAVGQALENVAQHSGASRAWLFADAEDERVTVSVRDNGRGFVYDEDRLKDLGKLGMLESMKARIEDLGGRMAVETAPALGTLVEFRVPRRGEVAG